MSSAKTKKYYVDKSNEIFDRFYNYDKFILINSATPGTIVCPIHGDFSLSFNKHICRKYGCPTCGAIKRIKTHTKKQDEYIDGCISTHGEIYDLSDVVYTKSRENVTPICRKHGKWEVNAASFLSGCGCPKCMVDKMVERNTLTQEDYIKRCENTHHNIYDLSDVIFTRIQNYVTPICRKHGKWKTQAGSFARGHGCPHCKESRGEKIVAKILDEMSIEYIRQQRFDGCVGRHRKLSFDFYIPKYNLLIEYDGAQHFYFSGKSWDTEENFVITKEYDAIKDLFCKKNNINLLRVPYNMDTIQIYNLISSHIPI